MSSKYGRRWKYYGERTRTRWQGSRLTDVWCCAIAYVVVLSNLTVFLPDVGTCLKKKADGTNLWEISSDWSVSVLKSWHVSLVTKYAWYWWKPVVAAVFSWFTLEVTRIEWQDDDKFHSSAKTKVTGCDSAADLTSLNVAYFVKMLLRC